MISNNSKDEKPGVSANKLSPIGKRETLRVVCRPRLKALEISPVANFKVGSS